MKRSVLKLGTRKSMLAWAQSSWVAREVERLNPDVRVELKGIETRGDRIQDVSLQKVEGKDFFVAEIDHALLAEEVDFTVHSMKDLSLERPKGLTNAAIPKRANPRDVILFGPQVMEGLKSGRPLAIGTSSPRRLENIPAFLKSALPRLNSKVSEPALKFVEIRGNVNTRLSRVHESLDSLKYLDGVVLAFAGLIRLWADSSGQEELKKLLKGVRWMVLPLKECPAAPAQGALAVECRAGDSEVLNALQKLHHLDTAQQVASERQLLSEWGGGCHQRFGATAIRFQNQNEENVLFIRGKKMDGSFVEELKWTFPQAPKEARPWDGSHFRTEADGEKQFLYQMTSESAPRLKTDSVFVAHWRAVPAENNLMDHLTQHSTRVWASGTSSWFKLAALGIWVEGCSEGFGFEFLQSTLKEPVLGLPEFQHWEVLTHQEATEEWKSLGMTAISTYQINTHYGSDAKTLLSEATHVFWSSGSQLNELKEWVPKTLNMHVVPAKLQLDFVSMA